MRRWQGKAVLAEVLFLSLWFLLFPILCLMFPCISLYLWCVRWGWRGHVLFYFLKWWEVTMHGGFYFYSFSERSWHRVFCFWTINGNYLKYVCCSTRSDGGHQHWWFSEWSHCVIVTVNRTEGQEWGFRAPILFLDAVGYFWDHDHSRILYK